jgi:hypothetical protein
MKAILNRVNSLLIIFVLVGAFIVFTEMSPLAENGGSLLLALLFWVAAVEGCIAVVAACEIVKARWISSVKKELLSVYPLLLLFTLLFLLLVPFVDSYPWVGRKGFWFNKGFFILRNFVLLMLAYLSARKFASESAGEGERRGYFAAIYLLVFVISQTIIAFDWVMSLVYPWISTLIGAYFFVESFYGGIALSAILYIFLRVKDNSVVESAGRSDLKDLATLIFGFSLLWAGLFYSQFLVIWYGNIPEEAVFLHERISTSPLREYSIAVLAHFFFIPFLVLLSRRAKSSPRVILTVSFFILFGILIERFVFLAPAVTLSPGALVIHFSSLLFLFVVIIMRGSSMRRSVKT